jgi:hypothetical protein
MVERHGFVIIVQCDRNAVPNRTLPVALPLNAPNGHSMRHDSGWNT